MDAWEDDFIKDKDLDKLNDDLDYLECLLDAPFKATVSV